MRTLWYSLVVTVRSTDALATPRTAVVSLLLVPLLGAGLVVAIGSSVGTGDLRMSALAAVIAEIAATVIGTISAQAGMDRIRGVLADVSPYGLLRPGYWAGKAGVGVITGVTTAAFLALALTLTDSGTGRFAAVALLTVAAVLPAGLGLAMLSTVTRDPFAVANRIAWLLPVTAGTVISTDDYPTAARLASRCLPGTWLVRALRGEMPLPVGIAAELAVGLGWLLTGALTLGRAEDRRRRGLVRDTTPA